LRGVQAKVTALWKFEAPPGAGDTHYALVRGTRCNLLIKQGAEQNYKPRFTSKTKLAYRLLNSRKLSAVRSPTECHLAGLEVKPVGASWEVVIPDKYRVGHEQHFAQVTEKFLRFLSEGKMPAWEVPNMLAKYYTTTEAYRLSQGGR